MSTVQQNVLGQPLNRLDGPKKVTGTAHYAYEYSLQEMAYGYAIQSTIAKGHITSIDVSAAQVIEGVLTILTHENAPRLASQHDSELALLQSNVVAYRGQFIAFVVAQTPEIAQQAAEAVVVHYNEQPHNTHLSVERSDLYKPKIVNTIFETDTTAGDVEAALASAPIVIDQTYSTPAYHNNPMEPHATIAQWNEEGVTLYDSNQGAHSIQAQVTQLFGLAPERVRIIAPYVGGGFGAKLRAAPTLILTMMAARIVRRPVKFALTRQHMFAVTTYRPPSIQHLRLGADNEGRLTAMSHDAVSQTSTLEEFAEQSAVVTRMMYAAPNRATTHRLARLDVPTPGWLRAPGECPGMFALESAMDELAIASGLDPIELRIRNETSVDPETGKPFSSRGLVTCLREGAKHFGWEPRDPTPGLRREGRWRIGTGVAASTYPAYSAPSTATIRLTADGQYAILIDAIDIGTGAWTILTQIAADALEAPIESIHLEIGDTILPEAPTAGGSKGTASWGPAIVEAAHALRKRLQETQGVVPEGGIEVTITSGSNANMQLFSMYAFGAQFAEVRVNMDTGEIRVPRLLGVFGIGRVMNAKTARSQLFGAMTMGLSMALHEHSVMDPRFGDYVNHDFAEYHIASNADVSVVDVSWIEENDPYLNVLGAKGVGEIGIVGTAAAIANATYHATGIRIRELPITLDKLLV